VGNGVHVEVEVVRPHPLLDTCILPKLNCTVGYPEFVEEISDALRKLKPSNSTILLGDFNVHIGNDAGLLKTS